ncbi:hypothetical protein [Chitinophaga sp. S165]|uniref:hypothetical protein n=1 Tax=Chitinophaga sp. S165 TaxID=2135462 RepID=UPI000D716C19|nr:hypothetical protein [Chitinophaga sp. S165]PWV50560.1 hypothetical protein C7475_104187 [Chitinophaga sp. S165]
MKKIMFAAGALSLLAFGACKKEAQDTAPKSVNAAVINLPSGSTLPNVINSGDEYVLATNGTYFLDGKTYVDAQGKITINPGVTIRGKKKSTPAEASALVITRGATIAALGDSLNPITFTSAEATPAVGDWGGVVILGGARTNQNTATSEPVIEGINLPSLPAGIDVHYGSATDANNTESSGTFKFVRILYAGAAISDGNELNSLTLGGVGSGTELHHVEAAYGQDDAFEFFGGTVNARYLVSLNTNDDIFDFDFGYTGQLQFILGVRRDTGVGASYADANGIESDNNAAGDGLLPQTQAKISNMTLISGTSAAALAGTLNGARLRRNTSYIIRNSVLFGYNNGVALEGGSAASSANIDYNLIHGYSTSVSGGTLAVPNNILYTGINPATQLGIVRPYAVGTNPITGFAPWPSSTSAAATAGTSFAGLSSFFSGTTYRGAFAVGSKNWITTWTVGL